MAPKTVASSKPGALVMMILTINRTMTDRIMAHMRNQAAMAMRAPWSSSVTRAKRGPSMGSMDGFCFVAPLDGQG